MARRRKTDRHLPARRYQRRGSYYFVEPGTERWVPLGREYAKAMAKYGEITDADRVCVTMNDVINRYRLEILSHKAENTRRNEDPQLSRLANWCGDAKPDDITEQDIYRYMDARAKQAPVVAGKEVGLLRHVYVKAIKWGAATKNPAKDIDKSDLKPKGKKTKKRTVTDEEFLAVWKLATPQMRVAMDIALLTGLRTGDLMSLTKDNVTDEGIYIETSKTEQDLLILYSPTLKKALAASKKLRPQVPGHFLIRTRQGHQYSVDGFKSNWQRLMRKAMKHGIKRFAFKDIRKKTATDKKNSENLEAASALLGHASTAITKKHYVTDEDVIVTKPLK